MWVDPQRLFRNVSMRAFLKYWEIFGRAKGRKGALSNSLCRCLILGRFDFCLWRCWLMSRIDWDTRKTKTIENAVRWNWRWIHEEESGVFITKVLVNPYYYTTVISRLYPENELYLFNCSTNEFVDQRNVTLCSSIVLVVPEPSSKRFTSSILANESALL